MVRQRERCKWREFGEVPWGAGVRCRLAKWHATESPSRDCVAMRASRIIRCRFALDPHLLDKNLARVAVFAASPFCEPVSRSKSSPLTSLVDL